MKLDEKYLLYAIPHGWGMVRRWPLRPEGLLFFRSFKPLEIGIINPKPKLFSKDYILVEKWRRNT